MPKPIAQDHPEGAGQNWLGSKRCGPTCVAMSARGFGKGQGKSDAEFIRELDRSDDGIENDSTDPEGIVAMAASVGLMAYIFKIDRDAPSDGPLAFLRERTKLGDHLISLIHNHWTVYAVDDNQDFMHFDPQKFDNNAKKYTVIAEKAGDILRSTGALGYAAETLVLVSQDLQSLPSSIEAMQAPEKVALDEVKAARRIERALRQKDWSKVNDAVKEAHPSLALRFRYHGLGIRAAAELNLADKFRLNRSLKMVDFYLEGDVPSAERAEMLDLRSRLLTAIDVRRQSGVKVLAHED